MKKRKHLDVQLEDTKKKRKEQDVYRKSRIVQEELLSMLQRNFATEEEPVGDVEFMLLHLEYQNDTRQPMEILDEGNFQCYIPRKPVLRLYGRTLAGKSVLLHVHNFEPYFYIAVNNWFTDPDMEILKDCLNRAIEAEGNDSKRCVIRIERISKTSLYGFSSEDKRKHSSHLKIVVKQPNWVSVARRLLQRGIQWDDGSWMQFQTFESNVLFILRFMVDKDVSSGTWIRVRPGDYQVAEGDRRISTCNFELDVLADKMESLGNQEDPWSQIPHLHIVSFDLEAKGRYGHFPKGEIDPCIQIASVLEVKNGQENRGKPICVIHALRPCQPFDPKHLPSFCPTPPYLISHETEKELLLNWANMICAMDPDILTGYNIDNFDLPYLMKRATVLGISKEFVIGRIRNQTCQVRCQTKDSQQQGRRERTEVSIPGRVTLDLLPLILEEPTKLRSYTLNSAASHYLRMQKEDVHHTLIPKLQEGSDADRTRLATYCLKDAILPMQLLDNRMCLINNLEMTRVTGISLSLKVQRGQQIKVFSQTLRKCKEANLICPTMEYKEGEEFQGAVVITPLAGYYVDPITTLDFASLYPSIMIAHNLCYSTYITDPSEYTSEFLASSCERTPVGQYFVKSSVKPGLLPTILKELLAARKRAKGFMKAEKDSFKKAVYDGRQLALKISANSVYGFTGADHGLLPCKAISSSVTGYGREMLARTKQFVEGHYCKKNGFTHDAIVVYGDTDSVMVKFGPSDLATCMKMGKEAAALVSKLFVAPISLEWEKCYWPYLLMNKKRYAGLYWSKTETYDKIDCKGMEVVRREICKLVPSLSEKVLEALLIRRNVDEAIACVKSTVRDLYSDKIDMSLLLMSRGLGQSVDEYKAKCGHITLAKKMQERDPSTAPTVGDRIFFVYTGSTRNSKNKSGDVIEDPMYALTHKIPLCADEYVDKQLRKPISRILKHVLQNPKMHQSRLLFERQKQEIEILDTPSEKKKKPGERKKVKEELNPLLTELWTGQHTRCRKPPHSKAVGSNFGILKYMHRNRVCQQCHAVLSSEEKRGLCARCESNREAFTSRMQKKEMELSQICDVLHATCIKCQDGTPYQDIDCHNIDCGQFFKRTKMDENLLQTRARLKELACSW